METNAPNSASLPMRLLSIDGGGLKGLIPAEALIAIETQLDALTGRSLPLSDRFDLIGGTSTGAILAVGLGLGLKAADLRDFYLKFGKHIFTKVFFARAFLAQLSGRSARATPARCFRERYHAGKRKAAH